MAVSPTGPRGHSDPLPGPVTRATYTDPMTGAVTTVNVTVEPQTSSGFPKVFIYGGLALAALFLYSEATK